MSAAAKKPVDLFLLEGISVLAFNKDFSQVALSKKDNLIYIYKVPDFKKTEKWELLYTLDSHFQYISGLDWHPETNRLLSCSYDKTSFVWDLNEGKWIPSNVVITTKLGFLCCKWNKRGDKFCEGTSEKKLFIGYFSEKSNWWMGINIKAHKSSVVTCSIDPTSLFVLSGSTDLRIYVSSCYIPEVDDQFLTEETKPLAQKFGQTIFEFKSNCWINSVAWLPSGNMGIVAGQDATLTLIDHKDSEHKPEVIRCKHSPVTMIIPIDDNSFYAVCYDRNILEYVKKGDKWEIGKTITTQQEEKGKAALSGSVSARLQQFQKMGNQKKENLAVTTKQAKHLHQSQISSVNIKGKDLITTDLSGFVKYWKL